MEESKFFAAPWGVLLRSVTLLATLILVGVTMIGLFSGPRESVFWILSMVVLPMGIFVSSACFTIRGYVLTPHTLVVRRLGWNSKVGLSDLRSVRADPEAMSRSLRTFGNGGLFSFSGAFTNKKLGDYRAFATDPKRSVVLEFSDRKIVVTPDHPKRFVEAVESSLNLPGAA